MVRTGRGQEFDDLSLVGRAAAGPRGRARSLGLFQAITQASLLVLTGILAAAAVARVRLRLAVALVIAIGGAIVTAEVLKRTVLTRPDLTGLPHTAHNSFPSGHATTGMSLALALVAVTAHRWRWLAALAAAVVATAFGSAVLTAGWHRPSDTIGAFLLSLAWFCGVMAVLVHVTGPDPDALLRRDRIEEASGPATTLVAGALLVALLGVNAVASVGGLRAGGYDLTRDYVLGLLVIDVVGVVVVGAFHLLMRGVASDGGPPGPLRAGASP